MKKYKYIIIAITAVILIAASVAIVVFFVNKAEQPVGKLTGQSEIQALSAVELLDLGEKYLLEMDYEQAIICFTRLIEIEPMNPRGYTGAAKAYISLGETEKAVAVLQDGLRSIPENADIQKLLDEMQPPETNAILSPSEIAEQEPWKLFENPLRADEVKFAGVTFWDCTLDDAMRYYPEGHYTYRDSEGVLRNSDGLEVEGEMPWDINFSGLIVDDTDEIITTDDIITSFQYATSGQYKYAWFQMNSEIRGIATEMEMDEALTKLGLSSEGIAFIKEVGGVVFKMDENGHCSKVTIGIYPSYDNSAVFEYYGPNNRYMRFDVCFIQGNVMLIEIISNL